MGSIGCEQPGHWLQRGALIQTKGRLPPALTPRREEVSNQGYYIPVVESRCLQSTQEDQDPSNWMEVPGGTN